MRFFKTTTDTAQEPEVEVDLAGKAGHVEKNPLPVHNEDAVHRPSIDRQLERRVVRKLDMNLVPLVMALCLLPRILLPLADY